MICGYRGFGLQCDDQGNTVIQIANIDYITVTRKDIGPDGICQLNMTIDSSNTFVYASSLVNFTFNCACLPWTGSINCPIKGMNYKNGFAIGCDEGAGTCHVRVVVPGGKEFSSGGIVGDLGDLKQLLEQCVDVRWKVDTSRCNECEKVGRPRGFDVGDKEFSCLCPEDQSSSSSSNNACTTGVPAGAVSPGTGNSKPISSLATPLGFPLVSPDILSNLSFVEKMLHIFLLKIYITRTSRRNAEGAL